MHATLGTAHDRLVIDNAVRLRQFPTQYIERVVEDTQQDVHYDFIHTTWPDCPRHGRHPLWLKDGSWWCEKDGIRVAALGALASTLGAT